MSLASRFCGLLIVLLCFCVSSLTVGCSKKMRSADIRPVLSHSYTVSVVPFSQPTLASDLIMGNLPEHQGRIQEETLARLDTLFRDILSKGGKSQRNFVFLKEPLRTTSTNLHVSAQPQGLSQWILYGKKHKADLLLVPYVLDWHEREGSRAGVTASAMVHVEFFLINIAKESVMARSIYEEKQQALSENFLNIGSFVKRGGAWVSATELALEGMYKAKKELGL